VALADPLRRRPDVQGIHPRRSRGQENYETAQCESDFDAEYRIVLGDGTITHLHTTAIPCLNESGDVVEILGPPLSEVPNNDRREPQLETAFERNQTPEGPAQDEKPGVAGEESTGVDVRGDSRASAALKTVCHVSKVAD